MVLKWAGAAGPRDKAAGQGDAFKRQGEYQHIQAQDDCIRVHASEYVQCGTAKVLLAPLTQDQMHAACEQGAC